MIIISNKKAKKPGAEQNK